MKIEIFNIHRYNHTRFQTSLWQKIVNYQILEAHWIIEGNFNFVESLDNKQSGNTILRRGTREVLV